jgi:acyl-CoA dehydrogenase
MSIKDLRCRYVTRPLFNWAKKALPGLSDTEREALEAGDVWWDQELFSGNPDWSMLLDTPAARLTAEEQAFIDGPVNELCAMLDDWDINWNRGDLPPEVWDYIKKNKFFAMIIPKEFGGLAFSPYANSEIVRRISTRSIVAAVTVMVPNSLGPGELLMRFGTKEQQDYWLPRLADGTEIPCFGLTTPDAGSDAAAMKDTGVVCKGTFNGEEVLGIRLNWRKRYITLGPVATVQGLAFKLYDPDHLLGPDENLGITVALIPTNLPGIEIGRRHLPSNQMFQNGPNQGHDVFVPLDHVIGGEAQVGKGWKMLMAALAAGRGISLPSLSAAAAAYCARTTGNYARVRQQFNIPIGRFEGIQERLGEMAANAYIVDAGRMLTCAALNEGYHPSVVSAIMKAHATYRMRSAVDNAMDVHAGKAIIDGPLNYMGNLHRSVPVGITVEGANILTRSMIIFGQGAIRCHPWLLKEMLALEEKDEEQALNAFDESLWGHISHVIKTVGRAFVRNWSGGLISPAPGRGSADKYYRQLGRYAASFALLADIALLTYGGALKRREMMSGRLGDILSELYLLSAVLKRWDDEGRQKADLPLMRYAMDAGFATIEKAIRDVLANLPNRPMAWAVKLLVQPLGVRHYGPSDALTRQCAELLLEPSATRDRITAGVYVERGKVGSNPVADLERAFDLVIAAAPIQDRISRARYDSLEDAKEKGLISEDELKQLEELEAAVQRVIGVDDFDPQELTASRTPAPAA